MITRRDFIKGLGAMAAALVMPRAEATETEMVVPRCSPPIVDNLGIYVTDEMLADSLFTQDELLEMASTKRVDNCRIFYADEDSGLVASVSLDGEDVTGRCDEFCGSVAPDTPVYGWVQLFGLTEDGQAPASPLSTYTRWGEVCWQSTEYRQPSVPLVERISYKTCIQIEYDEEGQEFVEMGYIRAVYEARGIDDRLIALSTIHADFIEDQDVVEAMLRNMDRQAEDEARERLGLNDDETLAEPHWLYTTANGIYPVWREEDEDLI